MSWRAVVLEGIAPACAPLLVVADPDGLCRDAEVHLELTRRGYTLLPYDDPIAFRVAYEAQYTRADGMPPLLVVLWDRTRTLESLPADLLARSVRRQMSLAALFPRLHIPILAELDSVRLDRLWAAYGQQRGPLLSAAATAEAVLQAGYGITLTALQTPADALQVLLTVHFAAQPLPTFLANVVVQQLRAIPALASWPLETLLHDRAAFDAFLSRAWPRFLHDGGYLTPPDSAAPAINEHPASYQSIPALPFAAPQVWPAIDTLFLAGRMQPLQLPAGWTVSDPYTIGVRTVETSAATVSHTMLVAYLRDQCPPADAPASAWLALAPRIGTLLRLVHSTAQTPDPELGEILTRLQTSFATWIAQRYATLVTTAPLPHPQLVSHLPHLLAHARMQGQMRHALIVMDGLALDQWLVLRDTWADQGHGFSWDERALFAWVPTLTSISRQAIFAGAPPTRFAPSLERTDREAAHWQRFWSDQGLQAQSVAYRKGLHGLEPQRGAADLAHLAELLADPRIQVIGLVIDAVDKIAHGMQQGAAGMLQQVAQWAQNGWCAEVITQVRDAGFQVTLTADHGNMAARGIGRIQDGILAEERGQRARIYADTVLRDRVIADNPELIAWHGAGLPADRAVVLARTEQAFVPAGQVIVTHGGSDLREVLVPWCVLQ
jgi:hypothetical protein